MSAKKSKKKRWKFVTTSVDPSARFHQFAVYIRENISVREHLTSLALANENNRPGAICIPLLTKLTISMAQLVDEAVWVSEQELVQKYGNYERRDHFLHLERMHWKGIYWQIENQNEVLRLGSENIGGQFIVFTGEGTSGYTMWSEFAFHSPELGFFDPNWMMQNKPHLYEMFNFTGLEKTKKTNRIFEEELSQIYKAGNPQESSEEIHSNLMCVNPGCQVFDLNKTGRRTIKTLSENLEEKIGAIPNRDMWDRKLFKCGACRKVYYCSRKCQKAHWRVHKKDCTHRKRKKKQVAETLI